MGKRKIVRIIGLAAVLGLLAAGSGGVVSGRADAASDTFLSASGLATAEHWRWPVAGPRVVTEPFRAPEHSWSAGHRGMDVAVLDGTEVRAPETGTIAFRGVVVDRPLLTIRHAGDLITTLEPVDSTLTAGTRVTRGEVLGTLAAGGHARAGTLHVGLRWHGAYINPMMMYGGVPRAILLPCCEDLP